MDLFITLEGGEGSGKSSQAETLKARAGGRGYRVALTREPGGCELGRRLAALLNDGSIDLDPRAELFLFEAARAQHVAEVILPALASHDVVICDRFADSSVAYQGHGRGLGLNHVRVANLVATQGLLPDLTVLLNVAVDLGLARARRARRRPTPRPREWPISTSGCAAATWPWPPRSPNGSWWWTARSPPTR